MDEIPICRVGSDGSVYSMYDQSENRVPYRAKDGDVALTAEELAVLGNKMRNRIDPRALGWSSGIRHRDGTITVFGKLRDGGLLDKLGGKPVEARSIRKL